MDESCEGMSLTCVLFSKRVSGVFFFQDHSGVLISMSKTLVVVQVLLRLSKHNCSLKSECFANGAETSLLCLCR